MRRLAILVTTLMVVLSTLAVGSRPGPEAEAAIRQPLSPELQASLAALGPEESITVIVKLVEQADLRTIAASDRATRLGQVVGRLQARASTAQGPVRALLATRQAEGKVQAVQPFWIFNGLAVTARAEVIQELARRPEVASIVPNLVIPGPGAAVATAATATESNVSLINAPALWALGVTGRNVVVANMDTGVDYTHPDLSAQWRGGTNSWYDPNGEHPTTPADLHGHGTRTMGIMVGRAAGGTAIGVAPDAQWIAVKIFADGGYATSVGIHLGFQWLLDPDGNPSTADAPHVVNNSWTMSTPGCNLDFQTDLQALIAAGIVPVFAAGNHGPGSSTSPGPSNNPEAFAIGATDNIDGIASFSSRGPSACGEATTVFPEIVAPGVGIRSSDRYEGYYSGSGTSFAAPHAAGTLALLLSAYPNLSVADQRAALMSSALDLGAAGPDDTFGYGRLDALAAYEYLHASAVTPTPTATATPTLAPEPPMPTATPTATSTPAPGGAASVDSLATGQYTGKRNSLQFTAATEFRLGDTVVVRAHVVDEGGRDLAGATVTLAVRLPDGGVGAELSAATNIGGVAEFSYRTSRKSARGTYTVEVTGVTIGGYTYQPNIVATTFTLN